MARSLMHRIFSGAWGLSKEGNLLWGFYGGLPLAWKWGQPCCSCRFSDTWGWGRKEGQQVPRSGHHGDPYPFSV